MKRYIPRFFLTAMILFLILGLLTGCKTKTVYVPVESVKTETVRETVHDTIIEVQIEQSNLNNITPGDTSYLKNKYSFSFAYWDGYFLHHTLETFDAKIPVKVYYLDRWHTINDTIRVPYPVEKELSKWEKIKMDVGGLAIGALSVIIISFMLWLVIRIFKNKIR